MSDNMSCATPNPDISGIGVRAAIYIQNLFCFVPVIIYLQDGVVSRPELKGIKDQSIGMLAIAYAILISMIIEATSNTVATGQSVDRFHAAIILDLSWMNNTSTWIWFILYVYHKSTDSISPVDPDWRRWIDVLWAPIQDLYAPKTPELLFPDGSAKPYEPQVQAYGGNSGDGEGSNSGAQRISQTGIIQLTRRLWAILWGAPVLLIGSFHLSLMAAIGIWLWSNPAAFGTHAPQTCDSTLSVLTHVIPFSSPGLRVFSLIMYSLLVVPGINLILPFFFFLTLHIYWCRILERRTWISDHPSIALIPSICSLVIINILFIIDIEKSLDRNRSTGSAEESQWGFGQVLALLLLVLPARDAWNAFLEIKNGQAEQMINLIEAPPLSSQLQKLGGEKFGELRESRYGCSTYPMLASFFGNEEAFEFLKSREEYKPEFYSAALQNACMRGDDKAIEWLATNHTTSLTTATRDGYGTALCWAAANGDAGRLDLLLRLAKEDQVKTDMIRTVGPFGTARHIMALLGKSEEEINKLPTDADSVPWSENGVEFGIPKILTEKVQRLIDLGLLSLIDFDLLSLLSLLDFDLLSLSDFELLNKICGLKVLLREEKIMKRARESEIDEV